MRTLIDALGVLGALLLVAGIYLLAGIAWAMTTAGVLLISASLHLARVHAPADS